MGHRQLQSCSLFVDFIVPVEPSRIGVTTRRRLINIPTQGKVQRSFEKKKKTSLYSLKFASLVLQVHNSLEPGPSLPVLKVAIGDECSPGIREVR